jgi:hypothetical protein
MHHDRSLFAAEDNVDVIQTAPRETACLAATHLREPPFVAETRRFLGRQELIARQAKFPIYDLPQLHQAIGECFADWRLVVEGGAPDSRTGLLWVPETRRMLVAPGKWAEFVEEATRFYRLPDGSRRVLSINRVFHPVAANLSVRLLAPRAQEAEADGEFTSLLARMARPHYLQGQVIKPDAEIFAHLTPCTWSDVALEPGVRETIERNTVEVLRRREAFQRHGVPLKRGILLYGPPGTGKTLLAKVLAGLKLATFVYATAADMCGLDGVRDVFELARKLAPTIVFFEDLDLFAHERAYARGGVLGEILAQLDGFENNDGLIFIGTTNDLEAIDPAIRQRPSRFDVVLHIGLPCQDARRKILAANLRVTNASEELLDEAAAATAGFSGAQVREVAYRALQRAVLRDASEIAATLSIDAEDVMHAIQRLRGNRDAVIGFGR